MARFFQLTLAAALTSPQALAFMTPYPTSRKKTKTASSKLVKSNSSLSATISVEPEKPLEGTHPKYPVENIVFQGGGAKGMIYTGCVGALDELGVRPYLKRFAATSAGCAPALFLSIGLNAEQFKKEMDSLDLTSFNDGAKNVPIGKNVFLGYNAFKNLGMHPATVPLDFFGDILERYTGNKDITFLEIYQRYGTELCITVSNVSRMQSEYCHVNTTPDMPVRRAMRASISLPFLFEPIELFEGEKYVDGALFANFPLKAFDGWYLSTSKEDSFFAKVREINPLVCDENTPRYEVVRAMKDGLFTSFQEPCQATVGFRIADDQSPDHAAYATFLQDLEKRISTAPDTSQKDGADNEIEFPQTKLAQAYLKKKEKELKLIENAETFENAYVEMCSWFIQNSDSLSGDSNHPRSVDTISTIKQINSNPPKDSFTPELFGMASWDEVICSMDFGDTGYITRSDIGRFWGKWGVRSAYLKNRTLKEISSLGGLGGEIFTSIMNIGEEILLRDPDNAKRTCTLDSKYVGLFNFELDQADKDFLFDLGKRDTLKWLQKKYDA